MVCKARLNWRSPLRLSRCLVTPETHRTVRLLLGVQVALEVGDDGAGDLAQVGGVRQQPGQAPQLGGLELPQGSDAVGLGHVVEQGDGQLVGVGVLAGQPGAGGGARLGLGERRLVSHGDFVRLEAVLVAELLGLGAAGVGLLGEAG